MRELPDLSFLKKGLILPDRQSHMCQNLRKKLYVSKRELSLVPLESYRGYVHCFKKRVLADLWKQDSRIFVATRKRGIERRPFRSPFMPWEDTL